MQKISKILAVLVVFVLISSGAYAFGLLSRGDESVVTITEEEYALLQKYQRLEEIQAIVDAAFLWDYDEDALMEGAAQGILRALEDDYSFYYTAEQMEQENEAVTGEYGGLGIEVFANLNDDTITIKRVFYGGPAQQAGILPFDKIVGVNGEPMGAMDMSDAVAVMRGEIGEEVTLNILRDQEIFDVTMTRALVQTETIQTDMLDGDIAYIRIFYFEGNLLEQFSEAVQNFQAEGAKGLILDMRDNPGGFVELAIEIADVFVGDGVPIMKTEDKYGRTLTRTGKEGAWEIPVVILQNGYSASASELVAVALQESGAKVVGTQSYGKGIMQAIYPFSGDGAGMQLTTDYWLSPSGRNLHEVGVTPDVEAELDEDAINDDYQIIREKDNQLNMGVETLHKMMDE